MATLTKDETSWQVLLKDDTSWQQESNKRFCPNKGWLVLPKDGSQTKQKIKYTYMLAYCK